MSVDDGMKMPFSGAEESKWGAKNHRLGAKKRIVTTRYCRIGVPDSLEASVKLAEIVQATTPGWVADHAGTLTGVGL